MATWDADEAIGVETAVSLVGAQFPDLRPVQAEPFGIGWDNTALLVNGAWVFRFPRRRIAVEFMGFETALLPRIAPRVPVAVPVPERLGHAGEGYPYPFAGYRLVPGATACSVAWTDAARCALAAPLARFLRALHDLARDSTVVAGAPGDLIGRTDLKRRAERLFDHHGAVRAREPSLPWAAVFDRIRELARTPPWTGPPALVHGDLYARHLLVDDRLELAGVIDWGDVHLGDPALDLGVAWSFLPREAHAAFREAYGPIDEATWARARFKALTYGLVLLDYGTSEQEAALCEVGRAAIRFAG